MKNHDWFTNKNELLQSIPKGDSLIILSKDVDAVSARKHFTHFQSADDLLKFLKHSKLNEKDPIMSYYEVIPNVNDYSIFMFFDLDKYLDDRDKHMMKDINEYSDFVLSKFLTVLERFLIQVYKLDIVLKVGQNVQISTACSPTKFSAHVRINIMCLNMLIMKSVATNLLAYTLSNTCTSSEERDTLTYIDTSNNTEPYTKTLVDQAVYTNFRSFRTIFSTKLNIVARPLLPYKDSSTDFNDHLVRIYDTNIDHIVAKIDLGVGFNACADFTKVSGVTLKSPYITKNVPNENQTVAEISMNHITNLRTSLENSDIVKNLLKTSVFKCHTEIYQEYTNTFNFYFTGYYCPYGQKTHRSNRSYFQYNYTKRCMYYKCFDECCRNKEKRDGAIVIDIDVHLDSLTRIADINNIDTLHCKDSLITWNECYNEPEMREYPIVPMCCVRGNMGTGKTKTIVEHFLPRLCKKNKEIKCLFITYQRLLSVKYLEELKHLGFINYMDAEHYEVFDKRVIVCLDSLQRIKVSNFDFIFIDEATSVFTHFNSEHMKGTQFISLQLELLLLQAKHIYFLDACVDNNIVQEVVDYIAKKKNIQTHFVKNEYVRPSNRTCTLHLNTCASKKKDFLSLAFSTVLDKIKLNKRVVVACSTKSSAIKFNDIVNNYLRANNLNKCVLLYHSESDQKITKQNINHFAQTWQKADVLIYSPTITSGVSFELKHFHSLVAYMENSFFTPTIDLLLQQVFRVRQLIDGDMNIFSHDAIDTQKNYNYPMTKHEMDEKMSENVYGLGFYYGSRQLQYETPLHINHEGVVVFDKDKLSYKILRSIMININKSRNNFTNLLQGSLELDYNIKCESKYFEIEKNRSKIKAVEAIIKATMEQAIDDSEIQFDETLLMSCVQYDELSSKKKREEKLSPREITQKWIFDCAINIWGVVYVDEQFFRDYIKIPSKGNIKSSIAKYFSFVRINEFLTNPGDDYQLKLSEKMQKIAMNDDHTFALNKVLKKEFYRTLLDGHLFLLHVIYPVENNYQTMLKSGELITIEHSVFDAHLVQFLNDHAKNLDKFCSTFDIKLTPDINKKLLGTGRYNQRSRTFFAKSVLSQAFDIDLKSVYKSKKGQTNVITLSSKYSYICDTYKPHLTRCCDEPDTNFVASDDDENYKEDDTGVVKDCGYKNDG